MRKQLTIVECENEDFCYWDGNIGPWATKLLWRSLFFEKKGYERGED